MVCGTRAQGDFADPACAAAGEAARSLADVPWTWVRQVHGSGVVVVDRPGAQRGAEGDAAVTCCLDAGLVVLTADCAPVGLSSPEGVVGVLHAGWRGLMVGVVGATVQAMRALGATRVRAGLGACTGPMPTASRAATSPPWLVPSGRSCVPSTPPGTPPSTSRRLCPSPSSGPGPRWWRTPGCAPTARATTGRGGRAGTGAGKRPWCGGRPWRAGVSAVTVATVSERLAGVRDRIERAGRGPAP